MEKYGSNERNVGEGDKSKRAHFNDGDTAAAGNENTGGVSNEDATNRKDTTVLENPDDKKIVPDEDLNAREEIKPKQGTRRRVVEWEM